jgi:transcriptional regulator with XRE-family HTH domain
MIDIAAHFGHNLARCRKRAGLSQEDLSFLASLHRTEVSSLERGLRLPRVDTLVKLTCSLEISADELLVGIAWLPGDYRPGGFKEVVRIDGGGD